MNWDVVFIINPNPSNCILGLFLCLELFGIDEQFWVPCGTREIQELGHLAGAWMESSDIV